MDVLPEPGCDGRAHGGACQADHLDRRHSHRGEWGQGQSFRRGRSVRLRVHCRTGRIGGRAESCQSTGRRTPPGYDRLLLCHPALAGLAVRAVRSAIRAGTDHDRSAQCLARAARHRRDDHLVRGTGSARGHLRLVARALCAAAGRLCHPGRTVGQRTRCRLIGRAGARFLCSGGALWPGWYQ